MTRAGRLFQKVLAAVLLAPVAASNGLHHLAEQQMQCAAKLESCSSKPHLEPINSSSPLEPVVSSHIFSAQIKPTNLKEPIPISVNSPDRRLIDPVETVRSEHKGGNNPLNVSASEWQARTEAAALHRALYLYGMGSDLAAQCVMHRIPDAKEFLLGEWGVFWDEAKASGLLKYDFEGNIIHADHSREPATPLRSNMGCLPVATAIMRYRPDVQTVIHLHPYSVMAVGGLKVGLLPLSQAAFFLYGQISREEYAFGYVTSFEDSLRAGFSNAKRAMLLDHHGMYAVGRDAAEAFFVAKHLTQACEVQVRTLSMVGGDLDKLMLPKPEDLELQYKTMMESPDYAYDGSREWPGLIKEIDRKLPGYNV